jgi:hypothetical protein
LGKRASSRRRKRTSVEVVAVVFVLDPFVVEGVEAAWVWACSFGDVEGVRGMPWMCLSLGGSNCGGGRGGPKRHGAVGFG